MHGDLIDQYRQMHREGAYGTTSVKKAPYILPYIQLLKPRTIVDYGCGQSSLAELISERCGIKATRYDPAIPAYETRPTGRCSAIAPAAGSIAASGETAS